MAAKRGDIFAANRAVGHVALSVKSVEGKTRRDEVHEAGSLRVRCPGAPAEELEAVLINTAGGGGGGGRFCLPDVPKEGARAGVPNAGGGEGGRAAWGGGGLCVGGGVFGGG